jgi:CubicO group peptidase (beta-lactamase class C family)
VSLASNHVRQVLERLVDERGELGLQVAAYLDGELVVDAWAGLADRASRRPVDGDTLFPVFSVSKGIASTCVHVLADRGLIDYDEAVAACWPEFGANGKEKVTVRDVLTHRAGIPQDPAGFALEEAGDWEAVARAVAALEPMWEPGTRSGYHPLTFGWVVGEVVRRVSGRPIGEFLQEEVCEPLGIEHLYFGVPTGLEGSVATLEHAPGLGRVELEIVPSLADPAGTFNRPEVRRAAIPGAGAIANARSVARHYAMLAGGGVLDSVRILSAERVRLAAEPEAERGLDPVLAPAMAWEPRWTLGYTIGGGPGPMRGFPHAFGYEGLGTVGFADPSHNFAFAFVKNQLDWTEREMEAANAAVAAVARDLGLG